MKFARIAAASFAVAALGLAGGCKTNAKKPPMAANPAVTDVRPIAPITVAAPIVAQPTPPQPVIYEASAASPAAATVAPSTPAPAAGGSTYTVQKGDTLSKIARTKYGELTAIRKIKEANPGVDYNHIKPGQKLTLP